jgi:DNA-binding MurR/RpiR family transcriptional regulator
MKIDHLSLLTSLFAIINENEQEDSFFVLAHYFLENYSQMSEMNIYEVAEKCYVSRASVRRFCQFIGYENFKNLKDEIKQFNENYESYLIPYDVPDYRKYLKSQIDNMIDEIDKCLLASDVDEIVEGIHAGQQVVFLASDTMNSRIKDFQKSLLLYGKTIRLVSDVFMDEELISNLGEFDYLITVSASGRFAYAARNIVKSCRAKNLLITASKNKALQEYYEKIYYLSEEDYTDKHSVFEKYGIDYVIDLIFSTYIQKYRSDLKYDINY